MVFGKLKRLKENSNKLESEEAIRQNKEIYKALCKDCKKKYRRTLPKLLLKKDKEKVIDKLIESLCFLCKEKVT